MQWVTLAFAVGFGLSIPVGPVASLVIRRTLRRGLSGGLAAGAGAALADAIYGALGVVGAGLPHVFDTYRFEVRIAAGLVLIAVGVVMLRVPLTAGPTVRATASPADVRGFAGTFAVAILNPGAAAIVAAVFATLGAGHAALSAYAVALLALFVGAMTWWLVLTALVLRFEEALTARALPILNAVTAGIAIAGGIAGIATSRP